MRLCPLHPQGAALRSSWLALLAPWEWRTRTTGGKPNLGRFQVRLFLLRVSLHRPHGLAAKPARPSWCPLKTTPTGEGWRLGFFVKGDGQKTHKQSRKKKTMKTKTQNQESGLGSRSAQSSSPNTAAPEAAPAAKKDNRLPIDREQRTKNRTLPTPKVLNLLLAGLPDAYRLAEVVGKWVWVHFENTPAAEIRQQLAQLGFHWNSQRQAWQHPCGQFSSTGSRNDPHEKYSSYFPADARAA